MRHIGHRHRVGLVADRVVALGPCWRRRDAPGVSLESESGARIGSPNSQNSLKTPVAFAGRGAVEHDLVRARSTSQIGDAKSDPASLHLGEKPDREGKRDTL